MRGAEGLARSRALLWTTFEEASEMVSVPLLRALSSRIRRLLYSLRRPCLRDSYAEVRIDGA